MKQRLIPLAFLCALAAPAQARTLQPPTTASAVAPAPKPPATVRVILTTAMGPFTLELEKERAPITTANFLRYVDNKRFDGIAFYRRSQVAGAPENGFIQGGTNDPKRLFPAIAHEPTTKTGLSHTQWAISMPRWAPGTAQADFLILLSDAKGLDANPAVQGDNQGFAVFGRVIDGFDTLRKIHGAPVSPTKGIGPMKGEMLEPQVKILTARRVPAAPPPAKPKP